MPLKLRLSRRMKRQTARPDVQTASSAHELSAISPVESSPDMSRFHCSQTTSSCGPLQSTLLPITHSTLADLRDALPLDPCQQVLDFHQDLCSDELGRGASSTSLDFTETSDTVTYDDSWFSSTLSSVRLSENADRVSPLEPREVPTGPDSSSTDSGVSSLGARTEAEGQDDDDVPLMQHPSTECHNSSLMSCESDATAFMRAPMCRPGVTGFQSYNTHRSISKRLKRFTKLRLSSRSSQLQTLAVL